MNLTSIVRYAAGIRGGKGTLSLRDNTLTLVDEDGNTKFEYQLSEITKVDPSQVRLGDAYSLSIYAPDKKFGWRVNFGNPYAEAVGRVDTEAQASYQEWLDFFQSQNLLVQGFSLIKSNLIIFYVGIIIAFVVLLASAISILSNH